MRSRRRDALRIRSPLYGESDVESNSDEEDVEPTYNIRMLQATVAAANLLDELNLATN
jgi:hypothetical protein